MVTVRVQNLHIKTFDMQKLHIKIDNMQKMHYDEYRGAKYDDAERIESRKTINTAAGADLVGISLRSYISYENDEKKAGTFKYKYIAEKLEKINPIDEEHGILEIEFIKQRCAAVFKNYEVNFCYLFGSYAKGRATETSDVDLLISTNVRD